MRIENISVRGLFDRFDHDLPLDPCERIAIIYGPNGFGKTMILRMVNALFNSSILSLGRMPFRELHVDFDDGSGLDVVRDSDTPLPKITLTSAAQEVKTFGPDTRSRLFEMDDSNSIVLIEPSERLKFNLSENLDFFEAWTRQAESSIYDVEPYEPPSKLPPWLEEIRAALPIRFIGTERLTDFSGYEKLTGRERRLRQMRPARTVRRYSNELGHKIQQVLTEYAGSISVSGSVVPGQAGWGQRNSYAFSRTIAARPGEGSKSVEQKSPKSGC